MPGAKIQPNNPANDPDLKPVKGHSLFKPNMSLYKTHRYGMIEPHFAFEVVPDDQKVSYRSGTDVDTQNLKAPLMTSMHINKDTFFVPLRAILPHNADLLTTNPLTGDDIEPENVNALVHPTLNLSYLVSTISDILGKCFRGYDQSGVAYVDGYSYHADFIHTVCTAYQIGSPILSYGSLAQSLGYNFAGLYKGVTRTSDGKSLSFDETLDIFFRYIKDSIGSFDCMLYELEVNGTSTAILNPRFITVRPRSNRNFIPGNGSNPRVTLRTFLELLEQGAVIGNIENVDFVDPASASVTLFPASSYGVVSSSLYSPFRSDNILLSITAPSRPVNIQRLVAYQLCCASFYTDDGIDYVYTSKLWHQNQNSLMRVVFPYGSFASVGYYTMNGVNMEYDSCSASVVDSVFTTLRTRISDMFGSPSSDPNADGDFSDGASWTPNITADVVAAYLFFNNIFGYQRSLRYRDYFVGSRTYPLAVGDVHVSVNNNQVDVVDVTKNIQMQRFLNQVNRIGRRIKEYSAGIFGVTPRNEIDEPIFLSHISKNIGAEETSNTGAAQLTEAQTVTSKLRKDMNDFIFSSDFNEFGIVIGVTTFDAVRPLPDAADRQLFHVDRFDMFNPFMQHIGDQDVFGVEINPVTWDPFGYKLRYSEYKQRTDRVAGGFTGDYLPGFCFDTKVDDLFNPLSSNIDGRLQISPDFIRMKPHEFDRFFNILPYDSMAGYFHFIIRHDNEVSASRPMEAAPSIL